MQSVLCARPSRMIFCPQLRLKSCRSRITIISAHIMHTYILTDPYLQGPLSQCNRSRIDSLAHLQGPVLYIHTYVLLTSREPSCTTYVLLTRRDLSYEPTPRMTCPQLRLRRSSSVLQHPPADMISADGGPQGSSSSGGGGAAAPAPVELEFSPYFSRYWECTCRCVHVCVCV